MDAFTDIVAFLSVASQENTLAAPTEQAVQESPELVDFENTGSPWKGGCGGYCVVA